MSDKLNIRELTPEQLKKYREKIDILEDNLIKSAKIKLVKLTEELIDMKKKLLLIGNN